MPEDRIPDALFVPPTFKVGPKSADRMQSILNIAEPLLGVDRSKGERGWMRKQHGDRTFIVRGGKTGPAPKDTIYFASNHERAGDERYNWVTREDGLELGYKVEGADD